MDQQTVIAAIAAKPGIGFHGLARELGISSFKSAYIANRACAEGLVRTEWSAHDTDGEPAGHLKLYITGAKPKPGNIIIGDKVSAPMPFNPETRFVGTVVEAYVHRFSIQYLVEAEDGHQEVFRAHDLWRITA